MKRLKDRLLTCVVAVLVLLLVTQVNCKTVSKTPAEEPLGELNVAYQWAQVALAATANDTQKFRPRPTVTSRYFGLLFTAMFDAWSRYDEKAMPVYMQQVERRPTDEHNIRNKEIAVSYAACRILNEYYFSDSVLFRNFMIELGYDPDNISLEPSTPEGIGNLAAQAVIEARRHDGANQYGDEVGSDGKPYFDYTNYKPLNSVDTSVNIGRWQPKYFADGKGGSWAPACLTPHWSKVKPIALKSADQFRPVPPPAMDSDQLKRELKEVVEMQAQLTQEQKALVEFMRDGPQSVQQAGHWLKFAQSVSIRDNHTLDEDVKMYFAVELAAMDAFIACWDAKMFYDYARPYALVHDLYADSTITGWGGEGKGWIEMNGKEWRPYSPATFVCPPFPAYPSGHSTASGACAEVLKLFSGSDHFGEEVTMMPGALTEPGIVADSATLKMPTFTETANMAGKSRVLGGYHIQSDNTAGLELGRKVGDEVWKFYLEHIGE